jgi:hypothetical protein
MLSATYQLTFTIAPFCGALLFEHVPAPAWGWAATLALYSLGLLYIACAMPEAKAGHMPGARAPLCADVCMLER